MCTVTWLRLANGYQLFCNRDEQDSRQRALSPTVHEQRQVKYIAPIDGDYGGSWIGVNELGLSLCLLNRYGDVQPDDTRNYISRGLLLTDLLDCSVAEQVSLRLNEFYLGRFRPFNLLVLPRSGNSTLLEWTGSRHSFIDDADRLIPLTSTSLKEPKIAIERQREFARLKASRGLDEHSLDDYHRSHLPVRGASSVCMHRDGAATVSLSKVTVTPSEILFEYESGSPCESNETTSVRLQTRETK